MVHILQGCGTIRDDQVKIVMGMDGRPSGEAYVEIAGPDAKFRLALAKDRQIMPVCSWPPSHWCSEGKKSLHLSKGF